MHKTLSTVLEMFPLLCAQVQSLLSTSGLEGGGFGYKAT